MKKVQQIQAYLREHRELFRFLGAAFFLVLVWVLSSVFFPKAIHAMHNWIIRPQANISASILQYMGYIVDQDFMVNNCEARLVFAGYGSICVGTGCSGLELFILFFGFILLMKGRIVDKLWFIPMGFAAILALNITRIVLLAMIFYHRPQYLEFNHKYTFVIIVYGAIFGLWLWWVSRFANKKTT